MDRSFDLVALLKQQPTKTHKIKPSQFVSVAGGVQKRLEINIKNRKSSRLSIFDRIRNIPKESPRPPPLSEVQLKAERRKQQLEKWKEEKEKKKKAAAAQKKKPFVAGVSHRKTFGPPPPPRPMPSTSGRITRSQASKQRSEPTNQPQSFAPTNASFKPPQFKNPKVPTLAPVTKKKTNNKSKPVMTFEPVLPKTTQNSRTTRSTKTVLNKPNLQTKKPDSNVTLKPKENTKGKLKNPSPKIRKSITSSIESAKSSDSGMTSSSSVSLEMSTPTRDVPRSESSSEEKLRSPRSPVPLTPEQIIEEAKSMSPFITMSRGKANARREMKKKRDEGLLDEDNSDMDSVIHFRRLLDSETSRILGICEAWDKIFAQTILPEPIQELVLTAVGQARLLVSQKMQQFAGLVERCARPAAPSALVTPADLAGFWDMLFMQVENVDMRFKKLEELRARGWAEDAPPAPPRAPPRPPGPRGPRVPRRPKPSAGPSQLRDMIAAARRAKKEQESQSSDQSESEKSESTPPESKTFEAGFFSVSSPLKKPTASAPATPSNKSSLLKSVLSSEARKASASKTSASFAMLRASLMSKNVDIEGVSPLMQTPTASPVNLFATPARSILKQSHPSSRKPEKLKVVLFNEETSSPASYTSCGHEEKAEVEEVEKENKPASRRRSRLSRQNAEDKSSPVMTRSRRKSAQTPLLPADTNVDTDARARDTDAKTRDTDAKTRDTDAKTRDSDARARRAADAHETPKRSSRRRKSAAVV